jgi:hypothetical protein
VRLQLAAEPLTLLKPTRGDPCCDPRHLHQGRELYASHTGSLRPPGSRNTLLVMNAGLSLMITRDRQSLSNTCAVTSGLVNHSLDDSSWTRGWPGIHCTDKRLRHFLSRCCKVDWAIDLGHRSPQVIRWDDCWL